MEKSHVILVRQEGLGAVDLRDHPFGLQMFDLLLHTLESQPAKPKAICFYTAGVKLVCKGSPVLSGLSLLEGMGVRLVACKTCLNYYKLIEQVAVGEIGGMGEIVKILAEADKVITV